MNAASGSVRPFRTAEFGGSRPTVPYAVHPFFCTAPMRSRFISRFMSWCPPGKPMRKCDGRISSPRCTGPSTFPSAPYRNACSPCGSSSAPDAGAVAVPPVVDSSRCERSRPYGVSSPPPVGE